MEPNPMWDRRQLPGLTRDRRSAPGRSAVSFKIASEDWEFQEIHRLNYETFVEEIPQHPSNPDGSWSTSSTPRTRT
jgi:hypothetical protein